MNKIRSIPAVAMLAAGATLALAGGAHAQTAGSLLGRVGVTQIAPDVSSGNLSTPSPANSKVDVKSATQLGGGLTYMLTDNIAIDLPLALPFKHKIVGDGSATGLQVGTAKVVPATLLAQYRFMEPSAAFRPYVGAGLTYANFFKEHTTAAFSASTGGTPANPTTISIDSKFGLTVQAGLTMPIQDRWFLDATILKTYLKTRTHLSNGQYIDLKLDPWSYHVAVGYRFW